MKKTFSIVLVFMSLLTFGQAADDFSDGDFKTNPTWTPGTANAWIDTLMQLRSNHTVASSSFYITTPSAKALNAEWNFFINLQFNTSSANYVDVYLVSQQANLSSTNNNGYFVRIGGTPDEISLYKVTAGANALLIDGRNGSTNKSNNTIRIKVIRDAFNLWSLKRDTVGGANFYQEGTATDNSFTTSAYFGFKIQQSTASFFKKHFIDDCYVGEIGQDYERPKSESIEVVNGSALKLIFNEKMQPASAQDVLNYSINKDMGLPVSASLSSDNKSVQINYENRFVNGEDYIVSVKNVKDAAGNVMLNADQSFRYFIAVPTKAKDVMITEIMADPTPVVGLPEAEFVEIYNQSSNAIDLAGWIFSDEASTAMLPSVILFPKSYLLLSSTANASKLNAYTKTIGVSGFPSLNNDGESLILKNAEGKTIDSLRYDMNWYKDDEKKDGGWSLELIDPNNICGEEDNWVASEDERGGSPGKVNSVLANKPDLTGPKLERVDLQNASQLTFTFNEKLQKTILLDSYLFSPAVKMEKAFFKDASLRVIQLNLSEALLARQLYDIHLINIYDCSGNPIQDDYSRSQIALPESADSLDLLINEILFNPRTGGVDFVELYNQSEKFINLKNIQTGNYENEFANKKSITSDDFLLAPAEYVVLTEDAAILKNHYPHGNEKKFLETDLPSLPDDEGSIAIAVDGKIIDAFNYSDKFHSPLIKDEEGVSLERISFSQPTNASSNWRSANAASGFATPGYINSNSRRDEHTNDESVKVMPEIFSPATDFVQVHYQFEEAGQIANVKVFDQQGREVKQISNNETIGYDGYFRWDGDRQDGSKALNGYYLIWFEVFNTNGALKTYRKRVIIASR